MKKNVGKNRFGELEDDDSLNLEDFDDLSLNHSMSGLSRPVKFKSKFSKVGPDDKRGNFKPDIFSGKKKKKRPHNDNDFF
jgi:hypothetical protein